MSIPYKIFKLKFIWLKETYEVKIWGYKYKYDTVMVIIHKDSLIYRRNKKKQVVIINQFIIREFPK